MIKNITANYSVTIFFLYDTVFFNYDAVFFCLVMTFFLLDTAFFSFFAISVHFIAINGILSIIPATHNAKFPHRNIIR